MQVSETITIIVQPDCKVTSLFTNTVFADPVEYTIGEAGFDLSFLFEQITDPSDCSLPMVYSLTSVPGRPNMLTLNSSGSKLLIAQSLDHSQIGIYNNVVLQASVENTVLTASITFNVQINPCPLTAFTTNGLDQSVTYIIGEAGISTNPYGTTT